MWRRSEFKSLNGFNSRAKTFLGGGAIATFFLKGGGKAENLGDPMFASGEVPPPCANCTFPLLFCARIWCLLDQCACSPRIGLRIPICFLTISTRIFHQAAV